MQNASIPRWTPSPKIEERPSSSSSSSSSLPKSSEEVKTRQDSSIDDDEEEIFAEDLVYDSDSDVESVIDTHTHSMLSVNFNVINDDKEWNSQLLKWKKLIND